MTTSGARLSAAAAEKLLQASTNAIVVVDDAGLIVFANPQAEALFGYETGGLTGKTVETLVPSEARERHRRYRETYKGKPHSRPLVSGLSLEGRRKDGSTFEAEIALTPIDGVDGKLVASTIRDVSDDDSSEAYFRHLLEVAPDAMIIVDDQGRISIVNGQAEKMFGYERDQLIGQPVEMLLPAAVRERHVGHRRRYVQDPRVRPMGIDMELHARRADGSEFPVEISLSPVQSASGSFVSSVIRDVTRRKRMEDDLISARQEAERAHKANTVFLAAASHDLRQPVQALTLLNGALRRTVNEPAAREMIESQQHSLDAMTNLLNSLLDISRLDAGAVTPEIEDFPVQRLIDRLAAECARQAQQKGLVCRTESNTSLIRSDPNLLAEIIQNLFSNAIRYTDQGEVSVSCRTTDRGLSIDICDTGIGIASEHIDEIFREFHQLKGPAENNEGFGLGLAIVRRLASLLQHEIAVTSTPGEGSCFSIIVPVVKKMAPRPEQQPAVLPDTSTGGVILLVEDDSSVASAWMLLLNADGYQVKLAETAAQAGSLAAGMQPPPDLIISDYHLLDGSNGLQAVAAVRRVCEAADLPALVVSGDTSSLVDDVRQLGNSLLLRKPVHPDELLGRVQVAIETGRLGED